MIVNKSMVAFDATTKKNVTYEKNTQVLMTDPLSGNKRYQESSFKTAYERQTKQHKEKSYDGQTENEQQNILPQKSDLYSNILPERVQVTDEAGSINNLIKQLRDYLYRFRQSILDFLGYGGHRTEDGMLILGDSGMSGTVWNRTIYESTTYSESESMEFAAQGKVVTADGRTIEFGMNVNMSYEFVEEAACITKDTVAIMTDPLVINLDSNPVSVSDQKWSFDIDGDGNKDCISLLSKGNGFLAFDKNGNGKIDDGTELFGTSSGNGFKDLAAYDEDGNGWIDENDSIYDKLSVWLKDDSGQDKLISLKQANVGALYLGSVNTDYALKSKEDNVHNAQIRKSGVYLTEEGVSKSLTQLDMVKKLIS